MRMNPRFVAAIGVVFTALSAIFIRPSVTPGPAIAAWMMVPTVGILFLLLLLGHSLFGEIPELSTLIGAGVIPVSSCSLVRAEARDARAAAIGHRSNNDNDL